MGINIIRDSFMFLQQWTTNFLLLVVPGYPWPWGDLQEDPTLVRGHGPKWHLRGPEDQAGPGSYQAIGYWVKGGHLKLAMCKDTT